MSRISNQEINDDNKAMAELIDQKLLNRTDYWHYSHSTIIINIL